LPAALPLSKPSMTLPSVAVIIPCYNAEKWVARAIQSALDQDYPNLEVIVIDDGSTDGSLDVIKSFGDRIRWETGPNRGACAARNRGLALTEAEYVVFLDADDWLVSEALSRQVARATSVDAKLKIIVFGDAIPTDEHGRKLSTIHDPWLIDGEFAPKPWIILNGPRTTSPLHRRDFLITVGGFREDLMAGQEYDLHMRLMRMGILFLYQSVPVFYYRQHNSVFRISNVYKSPDLNYWSHVYLDFLKDGNMSSIHRVMIAKSAWARGRVHLRHRVHGSEFFFDVARRMSPKDHMDGSPSYRLLCRLLGPNFAERVSSARARLTRPFTSQQNKE
jgi:glycosyltransferase involved in cell wall biosynthesis